TCSLFICSKRKRLKCCSADNLACKSTACKNASMKSSLPLIWPAFSKVLDQYSDRKCLLCLRIKKKVIFLQTPLFGLLIYFLLVLHFVFYLDPRANTFPIKKTKSARLFIKIVPFFSVILKFHLQSYMHK